MQKKCLGISLLTTSVLIAYMTTANAAQPNVSLEDILMDKGIITKEEWLKIKEGQNHENEQTEKIVAKKVEAKLAEKIESDFPVKADWGKKGFRLETRDGNWATNLQWRAQTRYTSPYRGDPRQVDHFTGIARAADASPFTGIGNLKIITATCASCTGTPMGQDSAFQILAKILLYIPSSRETLLIRLSATGQPGFQMTLQDLINHTALRLSALINSATRNAVRLTLAPSNRSHELIWE